MNKMTKSRLKSIFIFEIKFLIASFLFSLLYELAHSPLYIFIDAPTLERKISFILHCAFGDVGFFISGYHLTALILKNWLLLYEKFSWRNVLLFTFFSFSHTVIAELYHVHILGSWEYNDAMPIVPLLGIALTPFVQNLILPPLVGKVLVYLERK